MILRMHYARMKELAGTARRVPNSSRAAKDACMG
jgi:hypothetical protein